MAHFVGMGLKRQGNNDRKWEVRSYSPLQRAPGTHNNLQAIWVA